MKPKVLIVEDSVPIQSLIEFTLEGEAEVISTSSIRGGYEKFSSDIAVVFMDACVPGDEVTTPPLVRWMLEQNPDVVIVAMSGDKDHNKILMEAGCRLQWKKPGTTYDLKEIYQEALRIRDRNPA